MRFAASAAANDFPNDGDGLDHDHDLPEWSSCGFDPRRRDLQVRQSRAGTAPVRNVVGQAEAGSPRGRFDPCYRVLFLASGGEELSKGQPIGRISAARSGLGRTDLRPFRTQSTSTKVRSYSCPGRRARTLLHTRTEDHRRYGTPVDGRACIPHVLWQTLRGGCFAEASSSTQPTLLNVVKYMR